VREPRHPASVRRSSIPFACLQFEAPAPGATEIRQTAIFDAWGLLGLAYWYALYPLHGLVFAGMLRGIAARAQRSAA
jgi:hypothetical protein